MYPILPQLKYMYFLMSFIMLHTKHIFLYCFHTLALTPQRVRQFFSLATPCESYSPSESDIINWPLAHTHKVQENFRRVLL